MEFVQPQLDHANKELEDKKAILDGINAVLGAAGITTEEIVRRKNSREKDKASNN